MRIYFKNLFSFKKRLYFESINSFYINNYKIYINFLNLQNIHRKTYPIFLYNTHD